jgi:hypothetical protein
MLMNPFLAMISEVGLTEEFCVDFVKGRKKCKHMVMSVLALLYIITICTQTDLLFALQ